MSFKSLLSLVLVALNPFLMSTHPSIQIANSRWLALVRLKSTQWVLSRTGNDLRAVPSNQILTLTIATLHVLRVIMICSNNITKQLQPQLERSRSKQVNRTIEWLSASRLVRYIRVLVRVLTALNSVKDPTNWTRWLQQWKINTDRTMLEGVSKRWSLYSSLISLFRELRHRLVRHHC